MLTWEREKDFWEASDGETRPYRVLHTEEDGWEYQYLLDGSLDGDYGFNTAEEAMAAAEADYKFHENLGTEEKRGYTLEEIDEILGDRLYEERKEEGLF